MAPISVPVRLPSPPSTQIANTRPMYSRPTEGSTGWMMMRNAPASAAVAIEIANAMRLILTGIRGHQPQRELVLRDRHDGAADECAIEKQQQQTANIASDARQGTSIRSGKWKMPKFSDCPM